jgi:hypothetical protein
VSAPDLTQKVLGFRSWRLGDSGKLGALAFGSFTWAPGVNHAVCRKRETATASLTSKYWASTYGPAWAEAKTDEHEAPAHGCDCGFYAYHDLPKAWLAAADDDAEGSHSGFVYGAVAAWGRMEVHYDGFRAERVQPVVLAYSDNMTLRQVKRIKDYARKHGLRAVPVETLAEHAEDYGAAIPQSLRPTEQERDNAYRASLARLVHEQHRSLYGFSHYWVGTNTAIPAGAVIPLGPVDQPRYRRNWIGVATNTPFAVLNGAFLVTGHWISAFGVAISGAAMAWFARKRKVPA